jgi:hypothetical protein
MNAAGSQPGQRLSQQLPSTVGKPLLKQLLAGSVSDLQPLLQQYWTSIQTHIHEMDGYSGERIATPESPEQWIRPSIIRQKRGVDVETAYAGYTYDLLRKTIREAGDADSVRPQSGDTPRQVLHRGSTKMLHFHERYSVPGGDLPNIP